MILGMDGGVFAAWFLTILAAILCVAYGIYHEFIKKTKDEEESKTKEKKQKKEEK